MLLEPCMCCHNSYCRTGWVTIYWATTFHYLDDSNSPELLGLQLHSNKERFKCTPKLLQVLNSCFSSEYQ